MLIGRSRLGKSLRAAADNPEAATYMGIDVDQAHRIAFALGTGVTAIAGGLLATNYPFQPFVGLEYVIVMYAGVVLGGMGSIIGAVLGRHDHRAGAAALHAGAADAAAEHRDLRRLPADRLLACRKASSAASVGADLSMPALRSLAPFFVFAVVYAVVALAASRNSYYQLMLTLVLVWAMLRPVLEHAQRLHRPRLVRARGVLRPRRLHDGARADPLRPVALDADPVAAVLGALAGLLDRLPDLPAARPSTSRSPCSPIRWRCSTCSSGWAIRR